MENEEPIATREKQESELPHSANLLVDIDDPQWRNAKTLVIFDV
jgi:hypothetical protein